MPRRFSLSAWLFAFSLLALSMMAAPARPETARTAPKAGVPKAIVAPPVVVTPDGSTDDSVESSSCFESSCITVYRGGRLSPHVILVPQPLTEQARAEAEARDRRWVARCHPSIRPDRYGMPRYSYAAAGCEFGVAD